MHHRRVAHGHIVTQVTTEIVCDVQHGVVLDIGAFADNNLVNVAAQHGVVPDTRLLPKRHRAKHNRRLGDVNSLADNRLLVKIFYEAKID